MNNKTILILLGLSVLLLVGCTQTVPPANTTPPADNTPPAAALTASVTITDTAYNPQTITIKKGGTVTWTSASDTPNWPATAMHPTHEKYPGSSITKCATAEASTIFDACKGLANGETYSFTFNSVGEWSYHEHLGVKMFGKIIVVE